MKCSSRYKCKHTYTENGVTTIVQASTFERPLVRIYEQRVIYKSSKFVQTGQWKKVNESVIYNKNEGLN